MKIKGLFLLSISSVSALVSAAPISFEDQSRLVNISGTSETWGLTWTDINDDGWPDLFLQSHRDYPRIFRNTATGSFEDVANEYDPNQLWMDLTYDDKHGVSTVDVDNDGDQDVLISVSASGSAQLLLNEVESGGKFVDIATDAGVAYDGNARLGVWFDINDDGLMDLHQHSRTGSFLRQQSSSTDITFETLDIDLCPGGDYGQLLDINSDGHLDYLCGKQGTFPTKSYDFSSGTFSASASLNNLLPTVTNLTDSFSGDFNNDLKTDLIITRGALRPSGAAKVDDTSIDAWLVGGTENVGFEFTGTGAIEFKVDHHPMGLFAEPPTAVLNPNGQTQATLGTANISYSSATGKWTVTKGSSLGMYIRIRAANTLSQPTMINLRGGEHPFNVAHLVNSNNGLSVNNGTGLANASDCYSVVAADFDNDMDLDVYMTCHRGVTNKPNRYFDNQGNGTFVEVTGHGGEGPNGSGLDYGVSDSVAVADYDVDGFVDVAITNGLLWYPFGKGGPFTLLRNEGNSNHWIQLDLSGVASNRDGVGAKVYATAGGVTQLREQNSGYHRWSQNGHRIHFGLGTNTSVDITVEWPSGEIDNFTGVSADTLYEVVEGASSLTPVELGPEIHTTVESGDECGQPPYSDTYGPAITVWRDCGTTGNWKVRFNSGIEDEEPLLSIGSILGDSPFSFANGYLLGNGDSVSLNPSEQVNFDVAVIGGDNAIKGINLGTGSQTESCLDFTEQEIPRVILGGAQKRITAPFDLVNLATCGDVDTPTPPTPPTPPSPDAACGQPDFDKATEQGLFVWSDCDGSGNWYLRATGGGSASGIHYDGSLESSGGLSYEGFSIEPSDILDNNVTGVLDYVLRVWYSGQDGVNFTPSANSCLSLNIDVPIYFGEDRVELSSPVDLSTLQTCGTSVPAADPVECGAPTYNRDTDPGFYVWKNCDSASNVEEWTLLAASGGLSYGPFSGVLESTEAATVTAMGNSIESTDTLDANTGDTNIDFTLKVGGRGIDGIVVSFPTSSDTCLDMSTLLPDTEILVGPDKQPVSGRFNPVDLTGC